MRISRTYCALFVLALAAGCSPSPDPAPEQTRAVTGQLSAASMAGIVVPSVVAQDQNGFTIDAPVAQDGTFTLNLPAGRQYRLFVTDLRASGRLSTESRIFWPGQLPWATVPAAGTTSDGTATTNPGATGAPAGAGGAVDTGGTGGAGGNPGGVAGNPSGTTGATGGGGGGGGAAGTPAGAGANAGGANGGTVGSNGPINLGQIRPLTPAGATGGAGVAVGGSGTTDGTGGTGGAGGNGGTGGTAGTPGGTGGTAGSGGGGDNGASGSNHDGPGPALCVPPTMTTSESTGDGLGLKPAGSLEFPVPPCTATPNGGPGGVSAPPPSPPPAGAPTCEEGKVAVQDSRGRWDCVKMETPVTYFYSDKPIKVKAAVEFPRGVLTQWYPAALDAYPMVAERDKLVAADTKDKTCSAVGDAIGAANGLLDWGTLDILPRDANIDEKLPYAALDRFTWAFARQVSANGVRTSSGQLEKFLFYRGIGNFSLPVRVQSQTSGRLALKNQLGDAIGPVYFLNVSGDKGVFTSAHDGIAPGATLAGHVPSMDGAKDVETYADELARSVRKSLDEQGLYDDESTAMVNTWKRQWFRTPGARLLYIAPQSWTDTSIPLTLEPKPDSAKRVMVIRVEIVTPELEAQDVAALKGLANKDTAPKARDHFAALGRFAEPRLRRAITLAGHPAYAEPLLNEVILTNHTTHTPTAGTQALTPNANGPKYPGKGFVMHEWGTDTIVVGSDGSQLLGLQHEEEDLPKFVYDRNKK